MFVFRSFTRFACLFTFFLPALALPVYCVAQTVTTGEVTGNVVDASRAVVTGATVILKNVETGETRTVISNGAGLYRFAFVRPGTYELSVSSAGLKSDVSRLVVRLGQVQSVDLVLQIEAAKQSVTVTAGASLLDTDDAQSIYTLSERQLDELPLPGGDLVAVAYSATGVVLNDHLGGNGNFALQGIGTVSNLFTVNGADDMNPYWNLNNAGATGLLLGANEVREASVVQNAYEGQYGRQAGAQVNYITKSGTNSLHGNAAYTYGGSVLNANDWANNNQRLPRPHRVSNQYAAALGGPVVRDKLFFFADTEGLRLAAGVAAPVVVAPSKALEQYTLGAIQPSQAAFYQKIFDLYDSAPGRNRAVAVTSGNGRLQDGSGKLGCGTLAGTPTGFGGTFGQNVSCADIWGTTLGEAVTEWLASSRLDYNLSPRQHLYLRFKTNHGFQPGNLSTINPVFNTRSSQPDYETQFNHAFAITPRLTNNLTAAAIYYSYVVTFADLGAALKALPFQLNIRNGGANAGQFSQIGFSAFPRGTRASNLQFVDDLSYNVGSHWLKVGINYRGSREADLQFARNTDVPNFAFRRLDEFAHGAISSSSGSSYFQSFPRTQVLHLRLYNLGFYVQDEWALSSHLKLIGTLRFDRTGNPECLDHCFARLKAPFDQLTKGASIPYNASIQDGLAHAFYDVEPITVQPRFSFAYSPGGTKGMVIRGGVGLFSDLYPAFFASTLAGNAPNVFSASIRQGLVNAAGAGSAPAIAAGSAAAFNNSFSSGATLAALQQAVTPASFAPPSYYSVPSTLHTPKVVEWSAEIESRIGRSNVASVRYAGNHGYDLFLTNGAANASANVGNYPNGFGGLPLSTPDPRFAAIAQLTNGSYSNYNGLTASLRHAFGSNFQGQVSYTWSHALDLLSNGGLLQFSPDSLGGQMDPRSARALNYSNSDYDARHNLTLDFVWHVPGRPEHPALRALLAGWSLAGRMNAYSGTPFSVFDFGLAGRATANLGSSAILADVLDPNVPRNCGSSAIAEPCFTAAQFATALTQTNFGNTPRNSFRGPGYFNTDASLYKAIATRERTQVTVGASAFNLLNHSNLANPQTDVNIPGVGLITFAGASPSSPYGHQGATNRVVVVTGKLRF